MTEFEKDIIKVLNSLQLKKIEYSECSVKDNLNKEYYAGKKDAYEYACKLIKRAFEWHDIKIS